jgi:futalosine hydrolase
MSLLFMGAVRAETRWLEETLGATLLVERPWRLSGAGELLFLTGGIGPANAAGALAWALASRGPSRVIDVGSAGTYDPELLPLGAVAFVTDDQFVDMGTRLEDGRWRSSEELGLPLGSGPGNCFPCALPPQLPEHFAFPVRRARGATVHHVTGTLAEAAARRERSGALLESMEGAAAALMAQRFGVELYQVRGISNLAGGPREGWILGPAGLAAQQVAHWLLGRLQAGGP